jgi:hypothetical protein
LCYFRYSKGANDPRRRLACPKEATIKGWNQSKSW